MAEIVANDCVNDILARVQSTALFGDKLFVVYDPAILQGIAKKLNYPVCGIIYEGIVSEQLSHDAGVSTNLHVSIIVLAESRARDVTQHADKSEITTLLDTMRKTIARKTSPVKSPWRFVREVPLDLGDKGLVYYQQWMAEVVV